MRTYRTATTKQIPADARFSTRGGVKYVTATIGGKKVTGQVTSKGTIRIEADFYSLQFRDNMGIVRNMKAYSNKSDSEALGVTITSLMEPSTDQGIVENLPSRIKDKLAEFKIIENKGGGLTLDDLIGKYEIWLRSTLVKRHSLRRSDKYCTNTIKTIRKIAEVCKFNYYADINIPAIEIALGDMGMKTASYNGYVVAIKSFCKWAVNGEWATRNKITGLDYVTGEDKQERRAFTTDEMFRLLETTRNAPARFGLTSEQRVLMYLLATETGLRKNELLSLKQSSFDLDKGIVRLPREKAKNRKKVELPVRQALVGILGRYFMKYPSLDRLFPQNNKFRASDMLKLDLADANIPLETDEGIACFHSLRHTFSSNLDETSASWIQVKTLMRHTLGKDTTAGYTKKSITIEKLRAVVEQLPGFEYPKRDKAVG